MILNDTSFSDLTFSNFYGENVKLISNNAFGKASETIKSFTLTYPYVNHEPPKYHIWNVLSGLVNANYIYVPLNVTEIPSNAFTFINGIQSKLESVAIDSYNKLTIKSQAFYNLYHLQRISLFARIKKIQAEGFSFKNPSDKKLSIYFGNLSDETIFEPRSFDGILRPVDIEIVNSNIKIIPETSFKEVMDANKTNTLIFKDSYIDCTECKNYWMIKDRHNATRIKDARCMNDHNSTLFSPYYRSKLVGKCAHLSTLKPLDIF